MTRATRPHRLATGLLVAIAFAAQTLVAQSPPSRGEGGVSVSGSVFDAYPGVSPRPRFVLLGRPPDAPGLPAPPIIVPIDADGTFAFTHVPPGQYRIQLQQSGDFEDRVIDVGASDVRGIRLPIVGTTMIAVHAVMDDGAALPGQMSLIAERAQGVEFLHVPTVPVALPPGRVTFFLMPPSGYVVASLTSGAVNLQTGALDIAPAAPPIAIEAVLSRKPPGQPMTTTVSGRLTNHHEGVEVRLRAFTPLVKVPTRTTRVADDGSFLFKDVLPGVYALAIPPAEDVISHIAVIGQAMHLDDVAVPPGQIVATTPVSVFDDNGRPSLDWPGPFTLVFDDGATPVTMPVRRYGSWRTLAPNVYRVRVEGLAKGHAIRSLTAGSIDLLHDPLAVLPDRSPAPIAIVIETRAAAPAR